MVKDVRKHPWWGPKVRQLDGESKNAVIRPRILKRNFLKENLQKLQNTNFTSVLDFHLHLKKLISSGGVLGMQQNSEAVKKILASYSDNIKEAFPWFDEQEPLAHYDPLEVDLVACYGDHFYAAKTKDKHPKDLQVRP